jgi:hypothetical protein
MELGTVGQNKIDPASVLTGFDFWKYSLDLKPTSFMFSRTY